MKNIWERSIDLSEQSIYGYVWPYYEYKEILKVLSEDKRIILGGDILDCNIDKVIGYSGCNWYYEGNSYKESILTAEKYFVSIADWAKKEELFIAFALKK